MIFSSLEFFVLVCVTLLALRWTPREGLRRNLLLVTSYLFYGWWDWRFCSLILASTIVDFTAGSKMESSRSSAQRKAWLIASLCVNLGMLGFFKYANFFLDSLLPALAELGWSPRHLNVILPVGISFFTFQTMSYSIDVYRGRLRACRDFRDFALFVAFFPQLVAGPIVRASEFLPQLADEHPFRSSNLVAGAGIFLRGFVKKVLFADLLAVYVDPVFANPAAYSTGSCWLAVVAYSGQIYYDFSGYSDMAIGVGRMLGFRLPENFRHPYRSSTITEFWRRWHISLSRWLRDYLYIPLGGNRKGPSRTYVNLMITMLLGGLWHGAAWNFVVWGGLHGLALATHKIWRGVPKPALPRRVGWVISWTVTYVFVLVTWVFFRSPSFELSAIYLKRMFVDSAPATPWFYVQACVVLAVGFVLHVLSALRHEKELIPSLRTPSGWALSMFLLLAVLLFAPFANSPFIYFQF